MLTSARTRVALNASINLLGMLAQVAAVFVVSPVLIRNLGDTRYGVWALVESILGYLTLFDLGIGAAVVRYVARFDGTRELDNVNRTFSASLSIFSLAGAGVMAVAAIVLLPAWGLVPVATEYRTEAWWQFALLSFNLAVGIPLSIFSSVLDGLQRFAPKTVVRMVLLVARSVALVVVVTKGGGLLAVAITVTVVTLLEHVLMACLAWKYLPGLRFVPRLVDRDSLKLIAGYSFDAFVAMIAGRISFQTDAIVIGSFLPLSHITFFAIPARLCDHAKSALRALTTVLTPHVSRLEGMNDPESIRRLYVTGSRVVLWLIVPIQVGIWLLGKSFLRLWMGVEHADRSFPVLVVLASPLALELSQSVGSRIFYGIGRIRLYSRLALCESLVNLGMSLALVRSMGIVGVALGTAIPQITVNLLVVVLTGRILGVPLTSYLTKAIVPPCLGAAFPAAVWILLPRVLPITNWGQFLMVGVAGTVPYMMLAALHEAKGLDLRGSLHRRLSLAPKCASLTQSAR